MAIHKNATTISKLLETPLQVLQTLKNSTAVFANFEKKPTPDFKKCHWKWHEMAFFEVWKLQWHFYESPYLLWHLSNLFLRRKQGVNWAVRGTLACLDSLLFYIYHRPAQ